MRQRYKVGLVQVSHICTWVQHWDQTDRTLPFQIRDFHVSALWLATSPYEQHVFLSVLFSDTPAVNVISLILLNANWYTRGSVCSVWGKLSVNVLTRLDINQFCGRAAGQSVSHLQLQLSCWSSSTSLDLTIWVRLFSILLLLNCAHIHTQS